MSSMMRSRLQLVPTTRARTLRVTGSLAAKIVASTRFIHSRHRTSGGRWSSSRSKRPSPPFDCPRLLRAASAIALEPVDAERGAARQLTDGAEVHKTIEQAAQAAIAHAGDVLRGDDRIVRKQLCDDGARPLRAQLWGDSQQRVGAAAKL